MQNLCYVLHNSVNLEAMKADRCTEPCHIKLLPDVGMAKSFPKSDSVLQPENVDQIVCYRIHLLNFGQCVKDLYNYVACTLDFVLVILLCWVSKGSN